jgi:hypothetical protein
MRLALLVAKILKIQFVFGNVFEGFLTRFYKLYMYMHI